MNSLNLRVSSVKTGENIRKNAELRISLLLLPPKYLTVSHKRQSLVSDFSMAATVPEQVAAVRVISEKCRDDKEACRFLADLYFFAPLKHPVRSQILKLLKTADDINGNTTTALHESLTDLLKNFDYSSGPDYNKAVTSLSGCFDNFSKALDCLKRNISDVFPFLYKALQSYNKELSPQLSPSTKNEYYLYIHNLIRFNLACIQEFSEFFSTELRQEIGKFETPAMNLMLDVDIPMDVKTNCGILIAYIAKINGRYESYVRGLASKDLEAEDHCVLLCLCIGIINTIDLECLDVLGNDFKLLVGNIIEIVNLHSVEPCILLSGSRILLQVSKFMLLFQAEKADPDVFRTILRQLAEFSFSYLEHHTDSVRHISKDLLRNVIRIQNKFKFTDLVNEIFEFCQQEGIPSSLKCDVLIAISNTIGTDIIRSKAPNLLDNIFQDAVGRDLNINNCYENLMIANHKEVDYTKWVDAWIRPLLEVGWRDKSVLSTIETLINKAVRCEPKLVDFLLEAENKKIYLSTRLAALWIVRKNGLRNEDFQVVLSKFARVIDEVMISNEDDTKIMALRLIVESHKTTEPLSETECDILYRYLKYNANCQSPAIRERGLALMLKALVRLKTTFEKMLKIKVDCQHYRRFLKKIVKLLADNLFPGANFSRRHVSLTLLEQSIRIIADCAENSAEYIPEKLNTKLVEALNDSYESNKSLAVSVLGLILEHDRSNTYLLSLEKIKELITSVRPTDSLTAAYHLEYYCLFKEARNEFGFEFSSNHYPVILSAVHWCMRIMEEGLEFAKKSILVAARTNPLYGSVRAVRHLFSKISFMILKESSDFKMTLRKLIELCMELTEVVGPVVNSSSPEGHLPNDFSEIPDYLTCEVDDRPTAGKHCKILSSKDNAIPENSKTTPQMVLLCAWRTVKEVSLLLGEIVLRAPLEQDNDPLSSHLITAKQVSEISSHFKQMLSETKHRGAFEQAYVGFLKICTRLWQIEHSKLCQLPMQWLSELIELISTDERINEKICATRRSAGVPFMIQALITSELQVGTIKTLTYCMQHLIAICSDSMKSIESRTHSLNILRALFRCSDLNEVIGEYIADGIICAIRGYAASTWAERNSSTLLFAALITRIFGVQRTKSWENLSIRNKMTGRIFFLRYPKLYDFFSNELEAASESIRKNERPPKLHPLLLILSRLYPSALEGTESNLKISSFIDSVSICSGSSEMSTRVLTARAIVAFLTLDGIEQRILDLFQLINLQTAESKKVNLNYVHGLLLQIIYMMKQRTMEKGFSEIIIKNIVELSSITKPNPVIWRVHLDLIMLALKNMALETIKSESKFHLTYVYRFPEIFYSDFSRVYPTFRKSLFVFNLYISRMLSSIHFLKTLQNTFETFATLTYEEIETCLNILLLIFNEAMTAEIAEAHECSAIEVNFANSLKTSEIELLRSQLRVSGSLQRFLKEICVRHQFYPECTAKSYAVLSHLPIAEFDLKQMVQLATQYSDGCKDAVAKCVEHYVQQTQLNSEEIQIILKFVEHLSLPWNTDLLRLTAAKIVQHIAPNVFCNISNQHPCDLGTFVNILLCLSSDDDSDVRDIISRTIATVTNFPTCNISSTYAPIVLIRFLSTILKRIENDQLTKAVIENIAVLLNKEIYPALSNEDEDLDVFDKNEANIFAEPYKVLVDCMETFSECFSDNEYLLSYICTIKDNYRKI